MIFAIDDLEYIPEDLTILDVTFYKMTRSKCRDLPSCKDVKESELRRRFRKWQKEIHAHTGKKPTFDEYKEYQTKMKERILQRFVDKICVSTKVKADDKDEAIREGSRKIETALDFLRTYKVGFELRSPLNGAAKNLVDGSGTVTFEAPWHRDAPSPWKYQLNRNDLKNLSKEEAVLNRLILNPNPTAMSRRISRALRWTAMGNQEKDQADKIIKYITALECLFIKERTGKAKFLAERVAIIWTSNHANRTKIYGDFYRLYNLRNAVVHGNHFTIASNDEAIMKCVAPNLVFEVANVVVANSFSTINQLLSWLGSKKGSWHPPSV